MSADWYLRAGQRSDLPRHEHLRTQDGGHLHVLGLYDPGADRSSAAMDSFLGFALAITLLLSVGTIQWIPFVFPTGMFLISADILIQNLAGLIKANVKPAPSRQ